MTKSPHLLDATILDAELDPSVTVSSQMLPTATCVTRAAPHSEDECSSQRPVRLAARYELLGLLGSGGMGTVYRALDLELNEVVALKMLRRDLAGTPSMLDHFRHEVRLARKVTHRNVVRTFDIGEHGGDRFLTMEFIDGAPLSALVARRGGMPVSRVSLIGRELCAGLAASHEAGVVHGDLKPENVICAKGGRVVITDFGIARALSTGVGAKDSWAGVLIGTPAYMAPEQVEGVDELDGRADIYALGCMLYRLLTGALPWGSGSVMAVASARLLRPPPDPRERVAGLDASMAEVVLRCMARYPEERFATAHAVADALTVTRSSGTAIRPGTLPPPPAGATKSVAVLPIQTEGPADDEYLALGMSDDLIDVLSAVPQLRVRPQGATRRFASHPRDPRDAGRALGVDVVVDGALGTTAGGLRATLRVVTVEDGFQLWAGRFDGAPADLPRIVDEAATEIAKVLASGAIGDARKTPTNAVALDLYLRGRFIYARAYFDVGRAVRLLREAHACAPNDGRIKAMVALALMREYTLGRLPLEVLDEARTLADEVVAQRVGAPGAGTVEAHVALALVHLSEGEYSSAARELRRALTFDASNADALDWMGRMFLEMGRPSQAVDYLLLARAADPHLSIVDAALARAHAYLGEWDEAESALRAVGAGEDAVLQWLTRGRLALWRGDRARAGALLGRARGAALPGKMQERVEALLTIARDGTVSPETLATLEAGLSPVHVPRRAAFHAQMRIEICLGANLVDRAQALVAELEDNAFVDLSWIDGCPILAPLRATREFVNLRRGAAVRAARALEILDAGTLELRSQT